MRYVLASDGFMLCRRFGDAVNSCFSSCHFPSPTSGQFDTLAIRTKWTDETNIRIPHDRL
jgi:hypothetical protein